MSTGFSAASFEREREKHEGLREGSLRDGKEGREFGVREVREGSGVGVGRRASVRVRAGACVYYLQTTKW